MYIAYGLRILASALKPINTSYSLRVQGPVNENSAVLVLPKLYFL